MNIIVILHYPGNIELSSSEAAGQRDSLLDQCWLARQDRIISHANELRGSSDHNLISIILRTKDKITAHRKWGKDPGIKILLKFLKKEISNIDWTPLYQSENIDFKNTYFEEQVCAILEKHAPMKCLQIRSNYRNWVDQNIQNLISEQDAQKEKVRTTNDQFDWFCYRQLHNNCTKMLKKTK